MPRLSQQGRCLLLPVAVLVKVHIARDGAVVVRWLHAGDLQQRVVAAPSWSAAEQVIEEALATIEIPKERSSDGPEED